MLVKTKKNVSVFFRLLPFFLSEKKRLIFGSFAAFIISGTHLARPVILRHIIDKAIPASDLHMAVMSALIFIACLVIGASVAYLQIINLATMGVNIITDIKKGLFNHIIENGMSFFDKNQPGRLMSRTESDTEQLKIMFTQSAMTLLTSGLMLFGILFIIFREQPQLGLLICFAMPVLFTIFYFYMNYIRRIWWMVRKKNSDLSGYITEYVQGIPILQLFSKKNAAIEMLEYYSKQKYKYEKKGLFLDYIIFWSFFSFISETVSMIVIFVYGTKKIFDGDMSIGTLVMFIELLRQFFWPLRNLIMVLSQVQTSLAAGSRLFNILDTPSDVIDDSKNNESVSLREKLEFKDISFAYDKETVLEDIDLTIRKGQHIAIVGPSGSGKTTLINLLLRFYDPIKGEILVDDSNIKRYSLENWRKDIGLVLQDVHLFPGTIMENLKAFNPFIKDDKVIQAAKRLGSHETIMKKPDGYNTKLSEGGSNLSMGERQLISFTRALVKDPDILILDEATSSVDVITENMLQSALQRLMDGRTAIIIAHRLITIRNADRILVFEDGKIVEDGKHDELVEKGGLYSKLHSIQHVRAGEAL